MQTIGRGSEEEQDREGKTEGRQTERNLTGSFFYHNEEAATSSYFLTSRDSTKAVVLPIETGSSGSYRGPCSFLPSLPILTLTLSFPLQEPLPTLSSLAYKLRLDTKLYAIWERVSIC